MTEPAVGASTWASGSHVWNGQTGTLMAKPTKKAKKARLERPIAGKGRSFATSSMSNVPVVK